ncbi:MAG: CDP-2,3-bis-(O-geranylgeranyl)-sn-glycerol synthase [Methanomassiliicoccaceae archaeon]|jgi:CDP-2,3-bis-(O-geranylgeranyl)-sn-glycerol synthase|nr:CDP-2,3-bis-(O-geranylgeranyl)-sn-glycerol synthase [Methanomassiliicoccaceae archaeon]
MDVFGVIVIMLAGLWLFLPAMLPNSAAVVFGGGTPVDLGRSWKGKRILGDGKTWRGFFGGGFAGFVLGMILMGIALLLKAEDPWGYGGGWTVVCIVLSLSFGSLLGDMMGSFIKRRLGIQRGQKAPILDQYDFLIGAFLLTMLFNWKWVYSTYIEGWNILALIFLLAITLLLHRAMNIIGYKAGLKKEPW